jgi:magnesium transporter
MKELMTLNDNQLKKELSKMHPYDIAKIIAEAKSDTQMRIIKLMSLHKRVEVFLELPEEISRNYFNLLNENQKKSLLNEFEMDDLKYFITTFEEDYQTYLISLLSKSKQSKLNLLMSYDEKTIASIMNTDFVTINKNLSIKETTAYIINNSKDSDFIDSVYVVDDNNRLIGDIALKDLISARASDNLESITHKINNYLKLEDSINTGVKKFKNYAKSVLPVINNEGVVIGIVTADDVLNTMVLEHEEDIQKMTGVGDYEESSNAFVRAYQRMPWLLISVILNLVIAALLSVFEKTLVEVVALIMFQPMILGMAGNIGTQSVAVTILKLGQDELGHKNDEKKHILKEIGIGILNSIAIGIVGFFLSYAILSFVNMGIQSPLSLALTIGISLLGGMFVSSAAGVFIPIILEKMKVDPAIASGPIISTLNDLFALLIYFGIATLIFLL